MTMAMAMATVITTTRPVVPSTPGPDGPGVFRFVGGVLRAAHPVAVVIGVVLAGFVCRGGVNVGC